MQRDPETLDEALELLKKAVHNRKSLNCRFCNSQRTARTISFAPDLVGEIHTTGVVGNPVPQDSQAPNQKFESELKELRSSVTETQDQIAKILELLTTQRGHSRSPSPGPGGGLATAVGNKDT